jgi:Cu/Ag efflux protein CusF
MKKMTFSAIAAALIATPALAGAQSPTQSPTQTPPSQTPPPATAPAAGAETRSARADKVKGEVVKVDSEAKKITIKGADGVETVFAYTDATEVTGGQSGMAGLATQTGAKVTVHFKSDMGTKTATKIEVDDKKSS